MLSRRPEPSRPSIPGRRRIPISILAGLFAAVVAGACASAGPAGPPSGGPRAGVRGEESEARPLTPEQQAARRVSRIAITPDSVELQVGDSARVRVTALDSAGKAVEGAPLRAFVSGRSAAYDDSSGWLKGLEAGTAILYGVVAVPPARPGAESRSILARAAIRVSPLPVVRIELTDVPDSLYQGTRTRLEAIAFSRVGEREGAPLRWSSSDTAVLAVTDHGLASALAPGKAAVTARSGGTEVTGTVRVVRSPVRSLAVTPASIDTLTGDVVHLTVTARDDRGRPVSGVPVRWSVAGPDGAADVGAYLDESGTFVAERPGLYSVTASAGDRTAVAEISARHRPYRIPMKAVGHGVVHGHSTSDLWAFQGVDGRDYVYTGTHADGAGGDVLYAWDVTDPAKPVITDSVVVDARVVNDIKVNDTRQIAVLTREGASDRKNGIVLLDIRIPAHPKIITSYTQDLTAGVHNTWISGNLVYAVNDGTRAIHIIDISDPLHPKEVGRWEIDRPGKYLHDITIKDGLAYVSYWDDGLIILDVGAGIAGGTPTKPVEVSQLKYRTRWGAETYGNTHHAIRYENYVFVSDEIFGCSECGNGPRGYVHVIDVSDIRHPKEVAYFRVPEAGSHNLWAQDGRLYIAYYQGGLRVVDISGQLRGDLYRQGREIGWFDTASPDAFEPNAAMAWGPQVFRGHIFVSDMNSGLWIVKFARGDATTGASASGAGASGGGS
ncbi:MAG: hypothetical protein Q8W47_12145 [Candidatus Palauibacterales bacterium]|nr:hypothetical protein [Candidatus Palauibacterales bacterium]